MKIAENHKNNIQVLSEMHILQALESHLAMIGFNLNKEVIWVNENFAKALGYSVREMIGMKHEKFCTAQFRGSKEYNQLWEGLSKGEKSQGTIQRVDKKSALLWLEATYIPISDEQGNVEAVLKIATNVTESVKQTLDVISNLKEMPTELVSLVVTNAKEKHKP